MSYEVLARKWRPQVFQDVVGQEHIAQTLINAIKTDRLSHAYLFGGPRGVGKTSVARIFAKAINCEQGEPGIPCNKCSSCLEITKGSSVDVQEIDGASNRRIEEIRELRENIKYMPSASKYRIYIIDEVHMLTKEAFNALLKTLEEPPAHAKFIFATTESHKVPVTILSRCQRFDFKRISPIQIVSHLESISKEEGIAISKSGLGMIAKAADGSMRDAESLLDQVIAFTGSEVEDKYIAEILGIVDTDIVFRASDAVLEGSPQKCIEIIDKIYNYGYDIKEFYRALMDQFRNLLISLIDPQTHLLELSKNEREEVNHQAERAGREKLQVLLNFLINREADLRFTSHPRLILETTMIKLCHLGDFLSFGDLLEKIESLEKRLISSSCVENQVLPDQISDPGAQWVQDNQKQTYVEEKEETHNEKNWTDFLTFLSSKSKAAFNILKDWEVSRLTEKTLEIIKSRQSFSATYFDDTERYNQLSEYCRDFFQRDIKIKLVNNNQPSLQTERPAREESSVSETTKFSGSSQPVQDILDVFHGEIKERVPVQKGEGLESNGPEKKEEAKK